MDRVIRLALAASQEAVAGAGLDTEALDRDRAMVSIGSGIGGISTLLTGYDVLGRSGAKRVSPFTIPCAIANMPSGIVSIHYGFRGPNLCLVSACADSSRVRSTGCRFRRPSRRPGTSSPTPSDSVAPTRP